MFTQFEKDARKAASAGAAASMTAYDYVRTVEKTIECPPGRPWKDWGLDAALQKILFGWAAAYEHLEDENDEYETIYYHRSNESKLWITAGAQGTVRIKVITTAQKLRKVQDAIDQVELHEKDGRTSRLSVFSPEDRRIRDFEHEVVQEPAGEQVGYIWGILYKIRDFFWSQ